MFKGETVIGRVTMRCPPRTETLAARLRLAHLFQGAALAPRGFPPQAILVIRRTASPHNVSLKAFRLRPEWELEMREQLARLWHRAVRPVRGRVQSQAEAVLFQDEGEWLACLGIAVERRSVERDWCWQASLGTGLAVSSSQALVRVWSQTARFVPAAVVHLARWGASAQVLRTLQPAEADMLLAALSAEFDLPRRNTSGDARPSQRTLLTQTASARRHVALRNEPDSAAVGPGALNGSQIEDEDAPEAVGVAGSAAPGTQGTRAAPWARWLPAAEAACERLSPRTQRLFAMAVAIFHAPAVARSSPFAAEVMRWTERTHVERERAGDSEPAPAGRATRQQTRAAQGQHMRAARAADTPPSALSDAGGEGAAQRESARAGPHISGRRHAARGEGSAEVPARRRRTTGEETRESSDEAMCEPAGAAGRVAPAVSAEIVDEHEEVAALSPWANLEGCATRLGGVIFLLNLFSRLRLPECFDDDFHLSEHISSWGLAELFGRALLCDLREQYADDLVWRMLGHLDGRPVDEPPAARLRAGRRFRLPAHWLNRFVPDETPWKVSASAARMVLWHEAGKFIIAERARARGVPGETAALAADEAEYYRAQGLAVQLRAGRTRPPAWPNDSFGARARPPLTQALRRWMRWTFPFLKYVLARALTDEHQPSDEELARTLLVKRGRLFCTKTHVDLVMEMNQVSLPVRRAGLDATPGWIRDAMRVVSIHYE